MELNEKIEELQKLIDSSDNIVFFGGAGVSTESGIPDFRSTDGLYNQHYKYPPETILSHTFFVNKCEEFYDFYRAKMNPEGFEPNVTHKFLTELEKCGKLKGIITQNIDGLHQKAGSNKVWELHGSTQRNYCMKCGKFHGPEAVFKTEGIPRCECGGVIKPDVVLYEEGLNERTVENAINLISNADVLIIGGTSLAVYPAAGFIRYFRGRSLVLVNMSQTAYDSDADLLIHAGLGEVFSKLRCR